MDDPWDWDVDRVVQELCTSNRSWHLPSMPPKPWPLNQLEEALRENEVDGEVLLTYDQAELCTELGIKILKHKSLFKNAVHDIRLGSPKYRAYRKRQASEFEGDGEEVTSKVQQPDEVQSKSALEARSSNVPHLEAPSSDSTALLDNIHLITTDEQPSKKRRIVPTLLTTEIDPDRNRNIETEADTLSFAVEISGNHTEDKSANSVPDGLFIGAYLGSKSITRFDIADFNQSEPPSEDNKQINIVPTTQLIPGRMIQTHRLMKRRLLRRPSYQQAKSVKSDVVPGSNNPDHDEVLPLYGDSNDDMEFDSDTWKEIEEEERKKSLKQLLPKGLTTDEINSTFDRVLDQMASQWKIEKLPKYASKANRIWNDGRRSGLKDSIDRARQDLHGFNARIAKWKSIIQRNEYRNVKELETSLSSFELSVFDREHRSWLISVLTSPSEPPKISRPRLPRKRPIKLQPVLEDDEEILTTDSEDDLRDFIVDDELDVPIVDDDGSPPDTIEERHIEHIEYPDVDMDLGEDGNVAEANTEPSDEEHYLPSELISMSSEIKPTGAPKKTLQTPSKQTQPIFIDLTTPPDPTHRIIRYKNGKLSSVETPHRAIQHPKASPLIMDTTDLKPDEQKVADELQRMDEAFIDFIFSITRRYRPEDIWSDLILPALDRGWPEAPYNTHIKKDGLTAYTLVRLFEIYRDDIRYKPVRYKNMDDEGKDKLRKLYLLYAEEWDNFIRFLQRLRDRFDWNEIETQKEKHNVSASSSLDARADKEKDTDSVSGFTDASTDLDGNAEEEVSPSGERKKKRRKKRKEVVRDREAAITRQQDQSTAAELESRRKALRQRLITEGSTALGSQHGSIIVNESKRDNEGFIYIANEIARRIKEHQVTGVRFMWDQLVAARKRQGCLLAHTMGLGKTMQVLTLLVTIGQASSSDDPTVVSQIPEEMRDSRTLILCPATLVNNWIDEILGWLPENHGLGNIFKVDAILRPEARAQAVQAWDAEGGIMIIGYNLFKAFVDDPGMRDIFLERPNIVIADEAHMMKNPKAQTHVAAANFRTLSRVALTGSPLANNVEEYFSMINWVAPNYLGDIREFRAQYANPINHGLHVDSTVSDRRHALRMLRVLKSEVSPKVSRITIAVLKHNIPLKKEFVITVPLTPIQRQAYQMFIQYHSNANPESSKVPVFSIHDLSLICASPSIFLKKLENVVKGKNNSKNKAETVTLPRQLISDEMALLRNAERGAKDNFSLSWKVPMLLQILDQCKKLGDYVLLFSHSKYTLDYLEGVLRMKRLSCVRLDGTTHMADRQDLVKRFNKGNIDIFLISTRAGGLGLNITGANRVIIFDAQFNPQDEQQAVGRAYRIGQKKPVFVYRFVCGGTCEQKLLHQAIWKMQLASRVVDKKHPVPKAPRFNGAWAMPEEPEQKDPDPFLGEDSILDALLTTEKFREGIRAVEMMDVFEEEAVEDAELSPEDVALADQMILANEARRSGLPLPTQFPIHPNANNGIISPDAYVRGLVASSQPSITEPSTGGGDASQPPFTGLDGSNEPFLQTPLTRPLGIGQTFVQYSPTNITTWENGVPISRPSFDDAHRRYHQPVPSSGHPSHGLRPPSTLPPMQLPGAEVHTRTSSIQSNVVSDAPAAEWGSLSAIQGDLNRAFAINTGFPDSGTRSRISLDVSSAIWDNIQHSPPEQQIAMKWAIMHAVSIERFVQALCIGLISPQQLGQMTPEIISQQLKAWKRINASEWETKKESWSSQNRSRDPEHLQAALRRLSAAPNQGEKNLQTDQYKSCRLDDREALQAVFERRRLKTQQKDDQDIPRAILERRKTKDSSSQPSDTGKEPRLPNWARSVVRQAQIPAPSSPAPPKTSTSPEFPLRPQPRTPFQ
ncbi:hypothetical protein GGS24DRAFT_508634 [Hypoxylon argillaceum]|nr:hypothetical protein GGS24DRAFT_508634 [Hypoxylon argillaceum]